MSKFRNIPHEPRCQIVGAIGNREIMAAPMARWRHRLIRNEQFTSMISQCLCHRLSYCSLYHHRSEVPKFRPIAMCIRSLERKFTKYRPGQSGCRTTNHIRCLSTTSTKATVRRVLGIETSCDDTGAAVVDDNGNVLGEALHPQTRVHLE